MAQRKTCTPSTRVPLDANRPRIGVSHLPCEAVETETNTLENALLAHHRHILAGHADGLKFLRPNC